jgi:hypothetical protein
MFKKRKTRISSKLKGTSSETIRNLVINNGIKTLEKSRYITGNNIDRILYISESASSAVDWGTKLVGGSESAAAFGRAAYKTTKDLARKDSVCA